MAAPAPLASGRCFPDGNCVILGAKGGLRLCPATKTVFDVCAIGMNRGVIARSETTGRFRSRGAPGVPLDCFASLAMTASDRPNRLAKAAQHADEVMAKRVGEALVAGHAA